MKQSPMRRGLALVLTVFASLLVARPAFASTVTYKNQTALFVFDGGTGAQSNADLFGNMKGLYPGDSVDQTIIVKNENESGRAVEVFLQAIPHDASSNPLTDAVRQNEEAADSSKTAVENNADFLSKLNLKVVQGTTTIFDDSPDKTSSLENAVSLGTLAKDATVTLTATLEVPKELNSKYAGRMGEVDWRFTVKELLPKLSVEKTASTPQNGKFFEKGDEVTFTITVKNTGDYNLTNVKVTDLMGKPEETIASLPKGESKTLEPYTYTVTEADAQAGKVTNTATATADDPSVSGQQVSVDGSVEVPTGAPSLKVEKTIMSTPANGSFYVEGEAIAYKIVVTNDGNVGLSDVSVTDSLVGSLTEQPISLAAGDSRTFTPSYVVTSQDVGDGTATSTVTNTATATGTPTGTTGQVNGSGEAEAVTGVEKAGLEIEKTITSTPTNGLFYVADETIKYKIVVTNTGNIPLSNVTVTDELTALSQTIDSIAAGESSTLTASHAVTAEEAQDKARKVTNTAIATAADPTGATTQLSAQGVVDAPTGAPSLKVEKTITSMPKNGKYYVEGETIDYKIVVTNDGNVDLSGVAMSDPLTKESWSVSDFTVGATKTVEPSYTVTSDDVTKGEVENTATATAYPSGTTTQLRAEDTATAVADEDHPDLKVEKTVTSAPKNGKFYVEGETIDFKIVVTNTGNVELSNVKVSDDMTGLSEEITSLAQGEAQEFATSYTVSASDVKAGEVTNTATAQATQAGATKQVSDSGAAKTDIGEEKADLKVEKTVSSTPANGEYYVAGEEVTFNIAVTNTGNVDLSDVAVSDPLTGLSEAVESLAAGDSTTLTTTYTVTAEDVEAGEVSNTATATAADPTGATTQVSAEGSIEATTGEDGPEPEPQTPELSVKKTVSSKPANGEYYVKGEEITFKIVVTNTGDVDLSDVAVSDPLTELSETVESLAAGDSTTLTTTYTITAEDVEAGEVANTATATADDPTETITQVSAEGSVKAATGEYKQPDVPGLSVKKTVTSKPTNGKYYVKNEPIAFRITVTNTGDFDLSDVTVSDPLTGLSHVFESLAVGDVATFTTTYKATANDVKVGAVTNTASATADDPRGTTEKISAKASVAVQVGSSSSGQSSSGSRSTTNVLPQTGDSFRAGVAGVCALAAIALLLTAVRLCKRTS